MSGYMKIVLGLVLAGLGVIIWSWREMVKLPGVLPQDYTAFEAAQREDQLDGITSGYLLGLVLMGLAALLGCLRWVWKWYNAGNQNLEKGYEGRDATTRR